MLLAPSGGPVDFSRSLNTPLAERAIGLLGIATMIGLAYLLSYDRKHVPWRLVGAGLVLQTAFAFLVLKTTPGLWFFSTMGDVVRGLLGFTESGAAFVFGNLTQNQVPVGSPLGGGQLDTSAGLVANTGAFFAFNVLPTIIFFSSLTSVLYYLGVLQIVVKGVAWVMQRSLGTSGAETLSASGNIFIGQTEAPLLIKPFIKTMTPSEINTVMTGGFATVAGGVLAAYVLMLQDTFPSIAGHLMAASVMNAPAGLLLSKIILPETGQPVTGKSLKIEVEKTETNVIDAAAGGAATGAQLAINVGAMLMAFVALIYMFNFGIGWLGAVAGFENLTIQGILGWVFRPIAWVMGVPWSEAAHVGSLIGIKTTLTEFIAYAQLASELNAGTHALSPRSVVIASYALLGFANFPSIAIQIGGISGLAPSRRGELARLGLRAMIAGNLAAFMSASLAGMLL